MKQQFIAHLAPILSPRQPTDIHAPLGTLISQLSPSWSHLLTFFPSDTDAYLLWSTAVATTKRSTRIAVLLLNAIAPEPSNCRPLISAMETMVYSSAPVVVHRSLELV